MSVNGVRLANVKQETKFPAQFRSSPSNGKNKRKYLILRRLIKTLVFQNASLCDEVANTQAKILRNKEERRFLLNKLLSMEDNLEPSVASIPDHIVDCTSLPQDQINANVSLVNKHKTVSKVKRRPSPKKKTNKEDSHANLSKPKPKRKKPSNSIKRVVHPIPLDSVGRPVFPILLGGLTVHSVGEIITDRPEFHDSKCIYPVGYCSTRLFASTKIKGEKCMYTCKICDSDNGPRFEIAADNDPGEIFVSYSASDCHSALLQAVNQLFLRQVVDTSGKGAEFFGLSHPMIQNLIQSCQGARKCSKYQWIKFEVIRTENPQLTSHEIESDPSLSVDALHCALKIPLDVKDIKIELN